jgi:hypothetical protein
MDTISHEIVSKILDSITTKEITLNSSFDIISLSMELINNLKVPGGIKSDIVINILQIIVANKNGDFTGKISTTVLNDIQLLLTNNLIQPTINVIFNASSGKFNIGNIKSCCVSWFNYLIKK